MVLAIDVFYTDSSARSVGVLFDWTDDFPREVIIDTIETTADYIPGEFYKRELPCIMGVINKIDMDILSAIVVDGYVYTGNNEEMGLGAHVWESIGKQVPVIGVAKNSFAGNLETVVQLFRGDSRKPLYISSVGIELSTAVGLVKEMKGKFRMPAVLQQLDSLTRK